MSWSRHFNTPIKTPDGKTLRTLQHAAEYVLALPPNVQKEPPWQAAAECLTNAAEREIAWMWFARSAMMRALHGPDDPSVGNSEGKKAHSWRNTRKLARDR
jgi:hypothetical protein